MFRRGGPFGGSTSLEAGVEYRQACITSCLCLLLRVYGQVMSVLHVYSRKSSISASCQLRINFCFLYAELFGAVMYVAGEFLRYGGLRLTHFSMATLFFIAVRCFLQFPKPNFMVFHRCFHLLFSSILRDILLRSHTASLFLGHVITQLLQKNFIKIEHFRFTGFQIAGFPIYPTPPLSTLSCSVCGKTYCRVVLHFCLHLVCSKLVLTLFFSTWEFLFS